jgi:hypothetical protein
VDINQKAISSAFRVKLVEALLQLGDRKHNFMIAGTTIHPEFLLLGKNQHCRGGVWYAPNMDGGNTQSFAVYNVMSGCVWRKVLKLVTEFNL